MNLLTEPRGVAPDEHGELVTKNTLEALDSLERRYPEIKYSQKTIEDCVDPFDLDFAIIKDFRNECMLNTRRQEREERANKYKAHEVSSLIKAIHHHWSRRTMERRFHMTLEEVSHMLTAHPKLFEEFKQYAK